MNTNRMVKVALYGALAAVLIDYFARPTLRKTVGLD